LLNKLISGAIFNVVNIIFQVFIGLLVFREMLHYFGDHNFGVWSLLMAVLSHIVLFEFGLGSIIARAISVEREKFQRGPLISTSFFCIFILALLFSLLVLISLFLISNNVINFSFSSNVNTYLIILFLAANFALNFVSGAFQSYLIGNFYVVSTNLVRFISNLARGITILLVINYDLGIISVAITFFIIALFEFVCRLILSYKAGFKSDYKLTSVSMDSFNYLKVRGSRLFFLRLNDYIRNNSPILLVGFIIGSVSVVPLRVVGRLMEIYVEISSSINYLLTPYFSKYIDDIESTNSKFKLSIIVATTLSLTIYLNIVFQGEWFLGVWLGDFSEVTLAALQIISFGFFIANMQGPCTAILISKDKYKSISYLTISESLLTIIISLLMISYFGVLGAAYGVCISLCVIRGIMQPIIISRIMGIKIFDYLKLMLFPILIITSGFYLIDLLSALLLANYHINYTLSFMITEASLYLILFTIIYIRIKNE